MSVFNFKSAICTSREQSERLLALGLKKETADMCYLWYGRAEDDTPLLMDKPSIVYQGIMTTHDIPAWSLHRLIEMRLAHDSFVVFQLSNTEDAFEKVISHIEHAIKGGYFNKEYLENETTEN